MSVKLNLCKDYDEMSLRVADLLAASVSLKADTVLGLATGATPVGSYAELVRRHEAGLLSFAEVRTCNLDEYLGIGPADPNSYRYFMNDNLFEKIDIKLENTYVPDGLTKDPEAHCLKYDALVNGLKPDIQLLGLGPNGHIGFNEPGEFIAETHIVDLTEETIAANEKYFGGRDKMPKKAITMGLAGIMSAKMIVLAVSGEKKAAALRDMLEGPISDECPASILRLHPDVRVFADEAAASLLSMN